MCYELTTIIAVVMQTEVFSLGQRAWARVMLILDEVDFFMKNKGSVFRAI